MLSTENNNKDMMKMIDMTIVILHAFSVQEREMMMTISVLRVEQVTIKSAEKMDRAFEHWMGHNPNYRKQFLESHLKEYLAEI